MMKLNDKFFRDPSDDEHDFFDEGPAVIVVDSLRASGAIDTTQIDGYRQGIEIQSLKHWSAGLVKIHSGEPGHSAPQLNISAGSPFNSSNPFSDNSEMSAAAYITSNNSSHQVRGYYTGLPRNSKDSLTLQQTVYGGVIDPLSSHDREGFLNSRLKSRAGVRGCVESGNTNLLSTDRYKNPTSEEKFYEIRDGDSGSDIVSTDYSMNSFTTISFPSELLTGSLSLSSSLSYRDSHRMCYLLSDETDRPVELVQALFRMSGSFTDDRVHPLKKSMPAGFDFSNAQRGTDSIVYGGLVRSRYKLV